MAEDAVLLTKLEEINRRITDNDVRSDRRLEEINTHLRDLNGKVAEHERIIRERAYLDQRFVSMEKVVEEHSAYIYRRAQDDKDFQAMKSEVAELKGRTKEEQGGRAAVAKLMVDIATLLGIAVTLYKLFSATPTLHP